MKKCDCINALLWGQKHCDDSCKPKELVIYINEENAKKFKEVIEEEIKRLNITITDKKQNNK